MAEPPVSPHPKPKPKPPKRMTKLPKAQVQQLAMAGLSTYQIAKVVGGVNQSTIHRFLKKIRPDIHAVSSFKQHRADILAAIQSKNLEIQDKLIEKLGEESLLSALTPSQISGLVFALNSQHGTLYDKERLERGQSTNNVSLMAKLIGSTVSQIYSKVRTPDVEEAPAEIVRDAQAVDIPEITEES